MLGYTSAPRAWWITRGMARRAGVDLPRAVVEGWLSRAELADLVETCVACCEKSACEGQISGLAAPLGEAEPVPRFCPNRAKIEALQQ